MDVLNLRDKHGVLHFPRLDSILLVENFIRAHDGEYGRKRLWRSLPRGMMYQTFSLIIDYLLYSNKISVDSEGKIGWIHYPEKTAVALKRRDLFWGGE